MPKYYYNLYELISDDGEALEFFNHLPSRVRGEIITRPTSVTSIERLWDAAESMAKAPEI